MRLSRLVFLAALCAIPAGSVFHAAPVHAQAPSMPCSGKINLIRVSSIQPGMMEKFLQAVEAQKAWYSKRGLPDEIAVMRVMEQDPATKAWKMSDTQAITTHIETSSKMPAHDAEWDAFVAMFSASSKIEKAYVACTAAM